MKNLIRLFLISILVLIPTNVFAINNTYVDETADIVGITPEDNKISIYFFHGETCPHCAGEREWMEKTLKKKYDNIKIYSFEVYNNAKNKTKLTKLMDHYKVNNSGVPVTIVGKQVIVGWLDAKTSGAKIIDAIDGYQKELSDIKITKYINGEITFIEKGEEKTLAEDKFMYLYSKDYELLKNGEYDFDKNGNVLEKKETVVPIFGRINMRRISIPLIAIVLGFIDGFNPCAMWILLFLINMLLGMKNRKRMWILGLTFLFISGFVYFLSMLGISLVLQYITTYLKIAIGLFALIVGGVYLKKFWDERKSNGDCTVVDDKKRKSIISKIRKITSERSFILALIGVIVLAVSVNLIELACSLGLPTTFTEILVINNTTFIPKLFYMLLYIIFYMLDDIIVFVISMVTLEATGVTNKYGKFVHLIGGILMILMGLLLIFKPEWLMLNFS